MGKSRKWLLEAMTSSKQTRTISTCSWWGLHECWVRYSSTPSKATCCSVCRHHEVTPTERSGEKRHSAKDIQLVVEKLLWWIPHDVVDMAPYTTASTHLQNLPLTTPIRNFTLTPMGVPFCSNTCASTPTVKGHCKVWGTYIRNFTNISKQRWPGD